MSTPLNQSELEAYLDEALSPSDMARMEQAVREQPELAQQLSAVLARRDAGLHSLGEIWRRHRLSCPTREQLGSFLLSVLDDEQEAYLRFHTQQVGCRYCLANLEDLKRQQAEASDMVEVRRSKYFQSSARLLNDNEG